jgi:predicted protein tyrosine phosphatase
MKLILTPEEIPWKDIFFNEEKFHRTRCFLRKHRKDFKNSGRN